MTSIFESALGADFARLHPMMQKRFGVGLDAGYACTGRGRLTITRGRWWTIPFLEFGRLRNILTPVTGQDVPFTIENYPYRDPYGRETVTFVREYQAGRRTTRFDATMVQGPRGVVDYLGTHQHLVTDLDLRVDDEGGFRLRSGAQRFYEGLLGFRFPMLFSGYADLHERFDDDEACYRITLRVENPVFGYLFGYDGKFTCEFTPASDAPARLKPVRHVRRI